jgi:hypothetical protein
VLSHHANIIRSRKSQLAPGVLLVQDVVPRATAALVWRQRHFSSM